MKMQKQGKLKRIEHLDKYSLKYHLKYLDSIIFAIIFAETNEEFKNDDIFRIASMTKAITSFGVVKLWEKGLIDFDDPIKKYIPMNIN